MSSDPLLITGFPDRAREQFGTREIVDYRDGVEVHRGSYVDYDVRVRRLAGALAGLGVRPGDRVATLAWNHHRHLELYMAVPLAGAVLHTVNLRLEPEEIAYVIGHADDALRGRRRAAPAVRCGSRCPAAHDRGDHRRRPGARGARLRGPRGGRSAAGRSATGREDDLAALCCTSGTTGAPQGVGYSHRALFLHTLAAGLADGRAISERDRVLHVVPMFHANAWGIPLAALMTGADQVLPGPHPSVADIASIIERERATYVGMVPTIAVDLVEHARDSGADLRSLRALVLGGSTPGVELIRAIEEDLGVPTFQGWGMTEISPMGTFSGPPPASITGTRTTRPSARRATRRSGPRAGSCPVSAGV